MFLLYCILLCFIIADYNKIIHAVRLSAWYEIWYIDYETEIAVKHRHRRLHHLNAGLLVYLFSFFAEKVSTFTFFGIIYVFLS